MALYDPFKKKFSARISIRQKLGIYLVISQFFLLLEQRPLALGADICMYSATKYMNGKKQFENRYKPFIQL